ncbi:crotonase/enoyl-CoA hydratase family protein [Sandaracinus amylolyticus]|uniref:Enoyl-CoA hydratase/isomerase family protein n=1 Tax=Sandaracinus amylolyticus TaxID=927083 RepID=A0A0F6YHT5_9BACT|nr:crotonase/enoyl-CoA hydratase family protein [Sandaracinus amylolyticus]AKF05103.1 Enoyl-CoA hydratase/isomerase family protein [Sandaracinus amylolyticus]
MSEIVTYEARGAVAVIRMDDGRANAMSNAWIEAMGAALDRAEKDAAIKALVIAGRPGRFSAGFDLKVMMSGPEAARSLVRDGAHVMMRVLELRLPVVMAASGHAIAGGLLLAACGDRRIGITGDFKLGLNEVTNALPVPIFAHELARYRLDPRALEESVLRATMYGPEDALRVGWLDRLVAPEALEAAAVTEAETLATLPQPAYGKTKQSLRRPLLEYVRATIESNLESFKMGG